jgi:hypothetical protein
MHYVKAFVLMALCGTLLLAGAATAGAGSYEGVSAKHAAKHVRLAERDLAAAQARLRTARTVLGATRTYSDRYGRVVGRWAWLAADVGWPAAQWPTLFMVIDRESGGYPSIMNSQGSGAAGLLQLMQGFYAGDYYDFPDFNPLNPRLNLYYGFKAWKVSGWAPWSVN